MLTLRFGTCFSRDCSYPAIFALKPPESCSGITDSQTFDCCTAVNITANSTGGRPRPLSHFQQFRLPHSIFGTGRVGLLLCYSSQTLLGSPPGFAGRCRLGTAVATRQPLMAARGGQGRAVVETRDPRRSGANVIAAGCRMRHSAVAV